MLYRRTITAPLVALLAEGVDRNQRSGAVSRSQNVALLAEGVDRNDILRAALEPLRRRPPRGGRG